MVHKILYRKLNVKPHGCHKKPGVKSLTHSNWQGQLFKYNTVIWEMSEVLRYLKYVLYY
jgi:hypothetical protein